MSLIFDETKGSFMIRLIRTRILKFASVSNEQDIIGSRVQVRASRRLILKQWILKAQNPSKKFLNYSRHGVWISYPKISLHFPFPAHCGNRNPPVHTASPCHIPSQFLKVGTKTHDRRDGGFTVTHEKGTEMAGRRGPWSALQTDRWHHRVQRCKAVSWQKHSPDEIVLMIKRSLKLYTGTWKMMISLPLVSVWKSPPYFWVSPEKELSKFFYLCHSRISSVSEISSTII